MSNPLLDVTAKLTAYGPRVGREGLDLSGYIFKRASPSCGMERVKLYKPNGTPIGKSGSGIYARALMESQPLLPVEEEGRLGDPGLRENSIQRAFVYHRWQTLMASNLTPAKLLRFHARHKLVALEPHPKELMLRDLL